MCVCVCEKERERTKIVIEIINTVFNSRGTWNTVVTKKVKANKEENCEAAKAGVYSAWPRRGKAEKPVIFFDNYGCSYLPIGAIALKTTMNAAVIAFAVEPERRRKSDI